MEILQELQELGAKIRQIRIDQGRTQREVAIAADVTVTTITKFESGQANIGSNTFLAILKALGAEMEIKAPPAKGDLSPDKLLFIAKRRTEIMRTGVKFGKANKMAQQEWEGQKQPGNGLY